MDYQLQQYILSLSDEQKSQIFQLLRSGFTIHPLEQMWNIRAEFILEAISRSQDITKRGVRGIIAELAFSTYVLEPMRPLWSEIPIIGDQPYDAHITDGRGSITIQTKNQRLVTGRPLRPNATTARRMPHVADWYIAETQKTRSGKARNPEDGNAATEEISTRPYRFGEFDILSVCLHPSTGDWSRFMFTPASTLIPSAKDPSLIATLQPVPSSPQFAWTDNLAQCIEWVRNPLTMPSAYPNIFAHARP